MFPYAGHRSALAGLDSGTNLCEIDGTILTHRLLGDRSGWSEHEKQDKAELN